MNWTHLTSLNCGMAAQIRINTKGRACSLEIGRIPAEGSDPNMKLERHFRLESEQDSADLQEGIKVALSRVTEHQRAYDAHRESQRAEQKVQNRSDNGQRDSKKGRGAGKRESDKKPALGIKQLARLDAQKNQNPDAAADLARKEAARSKKPKNDRSGLDQELRNKMKTRSGK